MLEVTASIVIERGLGVIAMASVGLVSCLLLANTLTQFAVESLTLWLVVVVAAGITLFIGSLLAADRWAAGRSAAPSRLHKAVEAYGRYRRHPAVLSVFLRPLGRGKSPVGGHRLRCGRSVSASRCRCTY